MNTQEFLNNTQKAYDLTSEDMRKPLLLQIATSIINQFQGEEQLHVIEQVAEIFTIDATALTVVINKIKRDNTDTLVKQALASSPLVLAEGWFLVEGNPELNQLHINHVDKGCFQNMKDFATGTNRGWLLLAICKTHEAASEVCELIRTMIRQSGDESTQSALLNKIS